MAEQNITTVVDIQVKNSDAIQALYQYNVALQEVNDELASLKETKKQENGLTIEQQKQVVLLTEKQKALKKEMGEVSRQVQNNIIAEGKYQNTIKGLGAQLSVAKDTLRSMEMGTQKYGKAIEEAKSKLNQMERGTDAYKKQEAAVFKLQDAMDKANSKYAEQEAYVKSLNDKLKESEEAYGVYTRNVGNYKESAEMLRGELEGVREGIDGLRGGLNTVTQLMGLAGVESEGLQKATKFLTIGFTAFDSTSKLLNSTIKTGIGERIKLNLQTKAATLSTKLETATTSGNIVVKKAATIAQKALNAAMKANPLVLIISLLVAAGTALLSFSQKTKKATDEQNNQRRATEGQTEALREFYENIAKNAASSITQFELLRRSYAKMKGEAQKTEWIKENSSEIEKLGLAVNTVGDAEEIFVRKTGDVVKAYKMRAEAAAYQTKMEEAYARRIEIDARVKGQRLVAQAMGINPENWIPYTTAARELAVIDEKIDEYAQSIANLYDKADNLTGGLGGTPIKTAAPTIGAPDNIEKMEPQAMSLKFLQDEFDKEQEILKLRIATAEKGSVEEWEHRADLLTSQYMEEIMMKERTNEELELLEKKYTQDMLALDQEYADRQAEIEAKAAERRKQAAEDSVSVVSATLGGLSDIFAALGEDNVEFAKLSKRIALADVAVQTGVAIAKGISSAMAVPFPANLPAIATTISTVMSNIATAISTIKSAEFARGGYVSGAGTATSDSIPARLSNGESVLTAKSTSMFGPMLSAFNQMGGGNPILAQTSAQLAGEQMLARAVARGVAALQPVVAVSEIQQVSNRVRVVSSLGDV